MQTHDWISLLLFLIGWAGGLGVIYGIVRSRLDSYKAVLMRHEQAIEQRVRYEEYNQRHADIQRHLDRIEEKLDRIVARGHNRQQ